MIEAIEAFKQSRLILGRAGKGRKGVRIARVILDAIAVLGYVSVK